MTNDKIKSNPYKYLLRNLKTLNGKTSILKKSFIRVDLAHESQV
jgi:hypothetical protein